MLVKRLQSTKGNSGGAIVHGYFFRFISNSCKSLVFTTNLKLRVFRRILVRVSSTQIKKILIASSYRPVSLLKLYLDAI